MKMLKNTVGIAGVLVLLVFVIESCQSVATTSAKLRNQEGNYDIAIELCQQALAENPMDPEAYFQLGFAYSQKDMVALAYENFMKAKELDPKKARNVDQNIQHNFAKHYKLGQSGFNRRDYATSAEEFRLATEADPREAVGFYNLGVAYAKLGEEDETYRDKAIAAMDKVLEISNPSEANYTKALQLAGRQLAEAGREDEARERFLRLIEEDPTSYDVIESLGMELLNADKWKSAVVFLKMAAEARSKIDADDFTLFYNIGAALYNMREECPECVDEAIAYYERALALNDDEPQTVFNIAVSYVSQGDYRNATDWLEKYGTLSPTDPKGWQLLARCYSELGEKDKAREAMTRFEQLSE
jgi:Flp pilus assembly protein TadD